MELVENLYVEITEGAYKFGVGHILNIEDNKVTIKLDEGDEEVVKVDKSIVEVLDSDETYMILLAKTKTPEEVIDEILSYSLMDYSFYLRSEDVEDLVLDFIDSLNRYGEGWQDIITEVSDSSIDIITSSILQTYAEHQILLHYVEMATDEGLAGDSQDIIKLMQLGQYRFFTEVLYYVAEWLGLY